MAVAAGAAACAAALATVRTSDSAMRAVDPPGEERSIGSTLPRPGSGAVGWTWPTPVPGFRFGSEERFWEGFELSAARRAALERVATAASVDAAKLRVLKEVPTAGRRGAVALLASAGPEGSVCLVLSGLDLPGFTCLRPGSEAISSPAFVAVSVRNGRIGGRTSHRLDVIGVARGDVSTIRFVARGLATWTLYRRSAQYAWGAFALGVDLPRRWSGLLSIRTLSGAVTTRRLSWNASGSRVLLPAATR